MSRDLSPSTDEFDEFAKLDFEFANLFFGEESKASGPSVLSVAQQDQDQDQDKESESERKQGELKYRTDFIYVPPETEFLRVTPEQYGPGELLWDGSDIETKNSMGNPPLIVAAARGYDVQLFLEKKADVNAQGSGGLRALSAAVKYGYKETVKLLVDNKADVNAFDDTKFTPLMHAVVKENKATEEVKERKLLEIEKNDQDIVTILLEAKADLTIVHQPNDFPLLLALRNNLKMFEHLLAKYPGIINLRLFSREQTPLIIAIENRYSDKDILYMIEKGADVTLSDKKGNSPLSLTLKHANPILLREIINKDQKSIDKSVIKGKSPLVYVVEKMAQKLSILKLYKAKPSEFSNVAPEGSSLEELECHLEQLNILLEKKANVTMVDDNGDSAISVAVNFSQTELIQRLMADLDVKRINLPNGKDQTPLQCAVFKDDLGWAKFLLENKADPNTVDSKGYTPLVSAIKKENGSMVKLLFEYKASIEMYDLSGAPYIFQAIKTGNINFVEFLLLKNADVTLTDVNEGAQAFRLAEETKKTDMVRLIKTVVDKESVAEIELLQQGIEADFEEVRERLNTLIQLNQEPQVKKDLTAWLAQCNLALELLTPKALKKLTEYKARKLLALWVHAISPDTKAFFKENLQRDSKVAPPILPVVEQKPKKPPKTKISKFSRFLCIMNTGGFIPYDEKASRRLFAAAEDKNLPEVELKIADVDYKVSVKEMKQINVKTGYKRPICAFKSWPDEGPPFWNKELPKPLLPALQEDKLKGLACEYGALTFIVQALEAHGRTVIGVKFNKNVKLWAQYCVYRKGIELTPSEQAKEWFVWHGTSFLGARALIKGALRDFTVKHLYGKGVYTAINAEYSLDTRYASYYTGEIDGLGMDGKPVQVKNAQTLVACLITFGVVCKGTEDMVGAPPGVTAFVDDLKNPNMVVGIHDHAIFPFARVFVAGK